MQAKTADVSRGIVWFTGGWRLFMKNPGVWVVLGVIFIASLFVLALIPLLGQLLMALFAPVLAAGLLHAAREADNDRTLEIPHVLQGFREKEKLTPLLSLGGVALAGLVLSVALAFAIGGASMVAAMTGRHEMGGGATIGVLVALLAVLLVQLVVAMALAYAVPLVMFKGIPASQALGSSFKACLRNFLPLTVFGVIYLFVAVAATLPFFLGWIVLLPASAGMLYLSYKDLYENSG